MKRSSLLLAALCALGLSAKAAVGETFTVEYPSGDNSYRVKYEIRNESPATVKTVEQSNYQVNMPSGMTIVIPETVTYNGVQYTVTIVGANSFYGWKGVSLTLPNTIESIGASAFSMSSIPSISIGTGVKTIGEKLSTGQKLQR